MRLSPFARPLLPFCGLDREWSLHALADLDDGMFEQSDWWSEGDGLAEVFRGLEICPIFVLSRKKGDRRIFGMPDAV